MLVFNILKTKISVMVDIRKGHHVFCTRVERSDEIGDKIRGRSDDYWDHESETDAYIDGKIEDLRAEGYDHYSDEKLKDLAR